MSFETDIHCDSCGASVYICHHDYVATKKIMIKKARENGWAIGKYHLCPDCKGKREKLKKDGWLN